MQFLPAVLKPDYFTAPDNLIAITMQFLFLIILLVPFNSFAQHPYLDSLVGQHRIDEKLIESRSDTTIRLVRKNDNNKDTITERIIICRDKDFQVIRVDKFYVDPRKCAYAYFSEGVFELMQWNDIEKRFIHEERNHGYIWGNSEIHQFYLALLRIPGIDMAQEIIRL